MDPLARLAARSVQVGDCLVWVGKTSRGYGRIKIDGRQVFVHRVAWEAMHGPIPSGMVIRHTCDNPPCWLDEHLLLGSQAENLADMHQRGRARTNGNEKRAACSHGHPYPPEPRRDARGRRICLECGRLKAAAYRQRQHAARYWSA